MRIASLMKPEETEMDDPILCDRCSEELPEDFLTVAYVLRSTTDQDVQRICQDCHDRADWVINWYPERENYERNKAGRASSS